MCVAYAALSASQALGQELSLLPASTWRLEFAGRTGYRIRSYMYQCRPSPSFTFGLAMEFSFERKSIALFVCGQSAC